VCTAQLDDKSAKPNSGEYQGKRMAFPLLTTVIPTERPAISFNRFLAPNARKASIVLGFTLLLGCLANPAAGQVVAPGVAEVELELRVRGSDLLPVRVVFPSDAEGQPLPGPHPALVYIQGGFVSERAYRWQAVALAQRGYVVALPSHPNDIAFFAVDNAGEVRRYLRAPPTGSLLSGVVDASRIAVAGHSLGGVVAVKAALSYPFAAVAVQASFPDPADYGALNSLQGRASLLLSGERDCQALPAQVGDGFQRLPSPAAWVRLAGASHFQFTESDARDQNDACRPTSALAETHASIVDMMQRFLQAAFSGAVLQGAGLGPAAEVDFK
jgi:pimeloyl-ACP methyl ester carboxylesterase